MKERKKAAEINKVIQMSPTLVGATAGFGTRFLYTLEPVMGALLPLVGRAPAVANPAEKAVLASSLETFLITSILDTICLPLGGFSKS